MQVIYSHHNCRLRMFICVLSVVIFYAIFPSVARAVVYTVTNTNDAGAGSLRQAILTANASGGVADTINFNIGAGVQTITVLGPLPTITDPLTIDGNTQPGFAGKPIIVLRPGPNAGGASGLRITTFRCLVRGLDIGRFAIGIEITTQNAHDNRIQGCYLGLEPDGVTPAGNAEGVVISNVATTNLIGGSASSERNVISGNSSHGVRITDGGTSRNSVQGNYIGTSYLGNAAASNGGAGVLVTGSASINTVGGTVSSTANPRNLISGNAIGVVIQGQSNSNLVQGNYIGTNLGGTLRIPNTAEGVLIEIASGDNTIGGTSAGLGNLISGNGADGIRLSDTGTLRNKVLGNYIGTNYTGDKPLPNRLNGVHISKSANNNTVGAAAAATTAVARNIISANGQSGVMIEGAGTNSNITIGNYIGTSVTGSIALGNLLCGVWVHDSALGNRIGAISGGEANRIAYNRADGVRVTSAASPAVRNPIRGNQIFANNNLGIDLNDDNVTPNDAGDPDAGANQLQNYPAVTSVTYGGGNTTVSGTLNSTAGTIFSIDLYRSSTPDPSGYGEAETYVGSTNVTTNASGNAAFSFTLAGNYLGQYFATTATDPLGNTSEFGRSSVSVSGRVTTTSYVAIAGVTISRTSGSPTTTNSAGYYSFTAVPAGTFTLTPSLSGYIFSPASRTVVVSTTDVINQNFIGYPSGPYSLSGRVATAAGTAIPNVTMSIPGRPSILTNGAGYYTFPNLPAATYTVTPSFRGYAFVPTSRTETITNASIAGVNFIGGRAQTISGRVTTSAGAGIGGVVMTLSGGLSSGATATTNDTGYYTITNVLDGTYTLTPTKTGVTFTPANRTVTVAGASVAGQNFIGSGP